MDAQDLAKAVFDIMFANDAFSRWLGVELLDIQPGYARLRMQVREEMLNGFGIAHGGITYSLADSALAFASNSHGRQALSLDTAINHLRPVRAGQWLIAEATEEHLGNKTAIYRVEISDDSGLRVALFKGTVYRTGKAFETISQT